MSHYKPYPAYRDSGVEWIGQVPEHWARASIKHILSSPITDGPHETPVFLNEGVEFLSVDGIQDGELVFEGKRFISCEDHARFCKKAKPQLNDVLVGKSASVGKVARVKTSNDFNVWSPLAILRPEPTKCNPAYLEFALKADPAQQQILLAGNTSTQANIGMDRLASVGIPLPPIGEQHQLTQAIEQENTRIDALITKKSRFIELLKEKRQALITHAVTKGLDPNVKMRDSGVEWIGEVPEHWVAIKFNHVARVTEGLVDPKAHPYREMVLIAPNHIESGTGKILGLETAVFQNAESGKYTCKKGAVIYSKIRPALAKVAIAPCDCLCSADMYPMDCTDRTYPEWLFYLMLSPPFTSWAILESDRVAMPKINRESLADLRVFLPPMDEQLAAVAWLKAQVEKLEIVSLKTQHSIDLLKERRAAFITAAVTGQIDLRESA